MNPLLTDNYVETDQKYVGLSSLNGRGDEQIEIPFRHFPDLRGGTYPRHVTVQGRVFKQVRTCELKAAVFYVAEASLEEAATPPVGKKS